MPGEHLLRAKMPLESLAMLLYSKEIAPTRLEGTHRQCRPIFQSVEAFSGPFSRPFLDACNRAPWTFVASQPSRPKFARSNHPRPQVSIQFATTSPRDGTR